MVDGLLVYHGLPLKVRVGVYQVCNRLVMLFGLLTRKLMVVMKASDGRMLRYSEDQVVRQGGCPVQM